MSAAAEAASMQRERQSSPSSRCCRCSGPVRLVRRPSRTPSPSDFPSFIEARDVVLSFGQTPALQGASLSVAAGEILAITQVAEGLFASTAGRRALHHCLRRARRFARGHRIHPPAQAGHRTRDRQNRMTTGLLPATRADLLRRPERRDEAVVAYREAVALATTDAERRYLTHRLTETATGAR